MSKKIVFYNTYEPVVSLFRDLPQSLYEKSGLDVEIVISRSEYRHREIQLDDFYIDSAVKVVRVGIGFDQPVGSRWKKTVAMVSYLLVASYRILTRSADIHVMLTQPPMLATIARFKAKFSADKYASILMDLYPEVLFANGFLKKESGIGRWLLGQATTTRKNADALITIGRDMSIYLEDSGVSSGSTYYIPNWASNECESLVKHEDNPMREKFGIESDEFVVMYSGNMGVSHNFDDLLKVAELLKNRTDIKFVFVGGGPRKSVLLKHIEQFELDNVVVFDYQPAQELMNSLSAGDIHFVSLDVGFDGLVVPSKVFGALSAGRPIIFQGSANSEVSRMLIEHESGVQVEPGKVSDLQASILKYHDDAVYLRSQSANAKLAYMTHYSSEVGIEKYSSVLTSLN